MGERKVSHLLRLKFVQQNPLLWLIINSVSWLLELASLVRITRSERKKLTSLPFSDLLWENSEAVGSGISKAYT